MSLGLLSLKSSPAQIWTSAMPNAQASSSQAAKDMADGGGLHYSALLMRWGEPAVELIDLHRTALTWHPLGDSATRGEPTPSLTRWPLRNRMRPPDRNSAISFATDGFSATISTYGDRIGWAGGQYWPILGQYSASGTSNRKLQMVEASALGRLSQRWSFIWDCCLLHSIRSTT